VAALGYSAARFGLTAFRQETVLFWGLQEAQVIALVTAVPLLVLLAMRLTRARTEAGTALGESGAAG